MVGARAKEHYERLAKERQKERKGKQPGATSPEKLPELSTGDTRDQAGKAVGVSGRMIDHAASEPTPAAGGAPQRAGLPPSRRPRVLPTGATPRVSHPPPRIFFVHNEKK